MTRKELSFNRKKLSQKPTREGTASGWWEREECKESTGRQDEIQTMKLRRYNLMSCSSEAVKRGEQRRRSPRGAWAFSSITKGCFRVTWSNPDDKLCQRKVWILKKVSVSWIQRFPFLRQKQVRELTHFDSSHLENVQQRHKVPA